MEEKMQFTSTENLFLTPYGISGYDVDSSRADRGPLSESTRVQFGRTAGVEELAARIDNGTATDEEVGRFLKRASSEVAHNPN